MGVTGNNYVPFRNSDGTAAAIPATAAPIIKHVRHAVATHPDEKKQIWNLKRV
jgi:hypothetical protein